MVAGPAVRPGAEEAEHRDPSDAGNASGVDDPLRVIDVDGSVRLRSDLAIDPRAVDDRLATGERHREIIVAAQRMDLVPCIFESSGKLPPNEPGPAGDRDSHRHSRARRALSSANAARSRSSWECRSRRIVR